MLLDWINDELAEQRIIVKDLEEDMFDGQILQKLIGSRPLRNFWVQFGNFSHKVYPEYFIIRISEQLCY